MFFGVGATSARAPPPRSLGPVSALAIWAMRTVAAASGERRLVIPPARAPFGPADAPTISRGVTSAETRRMGRGRTRVPDAGDGALQTRERRVQIDFRGTAVGGGQLLALLLVVRGRRRGALVRRRRDAALQFRREGAPRRLRPDRVHHFMGRVHILCLHHIDHAEGGRTVDTKNFTIEVISAAAAASSAAATSAASNSAAAIEHRRPSTWPFTRRRGG